MKSFSHCANKRSFIKQTFTASWPESIRVYSLQTGARLQDNNNFAIYCHVERLHFRFEVFFPAYSSSQVSVDSLKCPLSVRCVCLLESIVTVKWAEKQQGPTPGVRLKGPVHTEIA